MADNELKIKISGDSKGFQKAIDETKSSAESLSKLTTQLSVLGIAAATAAAAAVVKGVQAYKEAELATNALNQSLAQQGIFTAELSKQYRQYAEELQKTTTFDDDAIVSGTAKIQSYLGQTKVTKELLQATLDFAQAQKIDVASAASAIGKSIGSSTNALGRYGIEVDATSSKQEKLTQVIDGLNKKFGGQSAAAAQGLGSIEQLGNAVGDIFELIGKAAAPAVGLVTGLLKDFAFSASSSQSALTGLSFVFAKIAEQISATVSIVNILGASIGVGLATAVEAASQTVRGNFSNALDIVKQGALEVGRIYDEENQKHITRVSNQNAAILQLQNDQAANEAELLRQSESNKTIVASEEATIRANELALIEQDNQARKAEMALVDEEARNAIQLANIEKELATATSAEERKTLIEQRGQLLRQNQKIAADKQRIDLELKTQQANVQILQSFGNLATAIGGQNSKAAFLIQKAGALAGAIVATNLAAAQALAVPPAPNLPLAAKAKAAGFLNVAAIAASAITGFREGGLVTGGVKGQDSVPSFLTPGELVVPTQNFEEVISAVSNQRQSQGSSSGGGGMMEVIIGFTENAFEIIEQKVIERRATGVGLI